MILLDTSVAIHLRDRNVIISKRISALSSPWTISLMTVVELEAGVVREPRFAAARRELLDAFLRATDVLPFNRTVVDAYAAVIRVIGYSRPRVLDRLIAATAVVHDLTLVTINGPDFHDIPDLKLEVWSSPPQ